MFCTEKGRRLGCRLPKVDVRLPHCRARADLRGKFHPKPRHSCQPDQFEAEQPQLQEPRVCFHHYIQTIICFGFKKTNREISTAGGEVIFLFFQKFVKKNKIYFIIKLKKNLLNLCESIFFINSKTILF